MRRLPFHPEDGIGPKSITLTSEIAKHNSRVTTSFLRRVWSVATEVRIKKADKCGISATTKLPVESTVPSVANTISESMSSVENTGTIVDGLSSSFSYIDNIAGT